MKTVRKAVLSVLCVALVIVASITGTLAYLTDDDAVVNTFTVGNVDIDLDEAIVNEKGEDTGNRTTDNMEGGEGNKYHLLPGQTYTKDPRVTVKAGSEESYVRMLVEVSDIEKLKEAFPKATETDKRYENWYAGDIFLLQMLVDGWDKDVWEFYGVNAAGNVYEFRYCTTVDGYAVPDDATDNKEVAMDVELPKLFTTIKVPGTVNNTELANLQNVTITVTAHAVQKAGFATANDAWNAFNGQYKIAAPTVAVQ